jgi:hypothetical protein
MNDRPHARYMAEASRLDTDLDERLADVRRCENDGSITVFDAAQERIRIFSQHREKLREVRELYFGTGAGDPT